MGATFITATKKINRRFIKKPSKWKHGHIRQRSKKLQSNLKHKTCLLFILGLIKIDFLWIYWETLQVIHTLIPTTCWRLVENASSRILCSSFNDFYFISSVEEGLSLGNKKVDEGQIRWVRALGKICRIIFRTKIANNKCRTRVQVSSLEQSRNNLKTLGWFITVMMMLLRNVSSLFDLSRRFSRASNRCCSWSSVLCRGTNFTTTILELFDRSSYYRNELLHIK